MKKLVLIFAMAVLIAADTGLAFAESAQPAAAIPAPSYNFGDFRSSTLASRSWDALAANDLEAVIVYTNKCLELYGEQARTMQAGLKEYAAGDDQKIFSFWALNDIATCLFIQGEAYRKAGQKDKAKVAFERVVKEFSFGQTYDPKNKAFWKPAEASKEKLDMMDKGLDLDFGDMSSASITKSAWGALSKKDLAAAKAYTDKNLQLYGQKAKEMQASLKEFPWESPEKIHSYWALNDIGTSLFILGQSYRNAGKKDEAIATFKKLVNEYYFSQCWDPQGWFWKPAEAAQQQIIELEAQK